MLDYFKESRPIATNATFEVYSLQDGRKLRFMTFSSERHQVEPSGHEPSGKMRAGNRALSVMDQIRESILDGSVVTGERLNEVRLSRTLAVSRTPVRAAQQALAGEGLLDYEPNRGFSVREFPLDAVVDAYEIRAALEGVAARFAAERGLSGDEKAVVERSLAAGDRLLERGSFETGDLSVYRGINGDF